MVLDNLETAPILSNTYGRMENGETRILKSTVVFEISNPKAYLLERGPIHMPHMTLTGLMAGESRCDICGFLALTAPRR